MTARTGDVITAREDLEALPEGSVVLDSAGLAVQRRFTGWWTTSGAHSLETGVIAAEGLPVRVLHVPGEQVDVPACGGCQGQGAHSPACRTQPGAYWYRVARQADALGDLIGANDMEMANQAWDIAHYARIRRDKETNR